MKPPQRFLRASSGVTALQARSSPNYQSYPASWGKGAQIICLSYLEADTSRANVRFAVKRLRRRLPESKILVGFWKTDTGQARDLCAVTIADFCATTFKDALDI